MPYRRRYRRRYTLARSLKATKYSNETYGSLAVIQNLNAAAGSHAFMNIPIIPNAIQGVLGTRKVKNITLRILAEETLYDDQGGNPITERGRIAFALVYVPEGTQPSNMDFGANANVASLYEPNQNVIMSGIVDSNQTYSFKTRLSRNLNAGDQVALILFDLTYAANNGDSITTPVQFTCNYAIAF